MRIKKITNKEWKAEQRAKLEEKGLYKAVKDELDYIQDEFTLSYVESGILSITRECILEMIKIYEGEEK